ncbi:uncharacterized protein LOC110990487 isoform X2 [Acanthaster planci]|uniref:Uncharacterized protein LOC110990487 isoform X2 n=1 Tax=Acanthaster planci TaxID=133434 RepID=A0A8B8A0C7_ACAPL|nr:uncharacterized protein LOC110990487 isoform X2 [Acanthaster planci]
MSGSKIPKAAPRGGKAMYVPGASPEAQNANLRVVVEELRAHIGHLKKELEAEKGHIKELKREKLAEVKIVRDQEQQKATHSLSELRSKLSHEKQRELAGLRESLTKQHDQEINRLLKQRQELLARTQGEAQRERETHYLKVKQQVWAEAKEEVKRTFEMDKGKLLAEIDELRRGKRRLEEELNDAVAGDRQRAADLRRQWGEHQREMEQLKKDARRDIQRLMEELKSKDRIIWELEKELGHKTGYSQRLQLEKESLSTQLNLSKMAESWDQRSSSSLSAAQESPPSGLGSHSGMMGGNDEEDKKLHRKIVDLNAALRKLEDRNKQLVEDKADLERKIRTSTEARNTTPLIEKNKRLVRKIKDLEGSKKKVDERNKALTEENQKLRSLKENMRCRLERENQSLRKVLSKERMHAQRGTNARLGSEAEAAADREEELRKLRVEVQEQFLEIVELKQAALEQERLTKATPDHTPSRLPVPISRPRSSSLTPFSLEEDMGMRSRSGSLDTSILSPLVLSDSEDGPEEDLSEEHLSTRQPGEDTKTRDGKQLPQRQCNKKLVQQNKELEEKCSKLEWMLQDSKDQNELLEFRILELEEQDSVSPVASPSTDDENQKAKTLEGHLLEKDTQLQSLRKEVECQRERIQMMEEEKEQRVSDLERTEAHLRSHIQELEDQLGQLQGDIHLGLAERNQEKEDLEAEIAFLKETFEGLAKERDDVVERLRSLEGRQEALLEEEEKLQKKLKKKEQAEANFKKHIEDLSTQLSGIQEVKPQLDRGSDTNESNNKATMETSQDVNALQQRVQQLELEKEYLEAKLRDVEELVLISDFANEESLREKIAELEQSNKLLSRQLKQSQASDVDSREVVEKVAADARDREKALQSSIQELQHSEQSLLDRVSQLEEQDNTWSTKVESLQDRIHDLEELRLQLKGKLDEAEERIEELQVAEKFARDELSASHGASSFLGESLGLIGELASLAQEEYVEDEEEDADQRGADQEPNKDDHIAELEKSETELMEKVQALEQANAELGDLCQDLRSQAFECAEENESLKQKIQELEELQTQIPEMVRVLEEAEEEKITLKEIVKQLEADIGNQAHEGSSKSLRVDSNDVEKKENTKELQHELGAVKEENLDLTERPADEHRKLHELERGNEQLEEQLQARNDQSHVVTTGRHDSVEELHRELMQSKSEKAQLEEQLQTECKELKSVIDDLQASKESLQQQLDSTEYELTRLEELSSELHAELEHRIEDLEREKEELEKRLGEACSSLPDSENFQQEQKRFEEENQMLILKLASAEEMCGKLQEQVNLIEKELQGQKSELKVARKDSMRKSLECDDSTRELADIKKRLKELEDVESQFFDQTVVLAKVERENENMKKQMEEAQDKASSLSGQLDEKSQELNELRETMKELEEAKETLQDKFDVEAELLEESSEELQLVQNELQTAKEELLLRREKQEKAGERVHELERQLSRLGELETENQKLQSASSALTVVGVGGHPDSKESLKQRVTDLTERERELQQKITEMEERQLAYEETVAQADLVVSETHQKLSEQNELLETKEQELQDVRSQLEYNKNETSHKLQLLEDTSHELDRKNQQLEIGEEKLKGLMNSLKVYEEKCQLQEEKLHELEKEEMKLIAKLESLQKSDQSVGKDTLKSGIETTTVGTQEVASAPKSSMDPILLVEKIRAMTENEKALQESIEEFQDRQAAFEETLAQADIILTETNQKLQEKTELYEIQESALFELRENVARLKEENVTLEANVTAAVDLETKSQQLEETFQELKVKNDKIRKLTGDLEMLTQDLESSQNSCKDLENRLQEIEQSENERKTSALEQQSVASLQKRIVDMTAHEEALQQRISELEERQAAFEETLAQADVIMTERESGLREQISELQSSHSDLQEKLRRVSEAEKQGLTSLSSDEDDDKNTQYLSAFSPDAKTDDLEVQRKVSRLEGDIERLKYSERELQQVVKNYKTMEESLKSVNGDLQEQLNLARDKIKQLENALKVQGPDNDLQAQLEELKAGVVMHEETNQRLKEEIKILKETISDLQDQLLQSPYQQISEDGFLKSGASVDEDELVRPQIVIAEEAQVPTEAGLTQLSPQATLDPKDTIKRLEQEIYEAKDQLKEAKAAEDSLKATVADREVAFERLEKANKSLQDDMDITTSRIEELEQQLNQISHSNNDSIPVGSEVQSEQHVQELEEKIKDLRKKLKASEMENSELQCGFELSAQNRVKASKEPEHSEQLKVQELEKSIEWFKQEMASANSERVKTTNRLTEIVQYNREIKKDLRELEEAEKILKMDNGRLKREKDVLNKKLSTLGISGEDLLKEMISQEKEDDKKQDRKPKVKFGNEQSSSIINKGSQTGALTYIPNECLLATVLIEEFEMTLKEFLEALPQGCSPTDPVLLREGKNFFVEFNKLFIGKCRKPRARLLRGLSRKLPEVKPHPQGVKRKPIYPSLLGEECSKTEAGSGAQSNLRPLEAASPTTKRRMLDEFVAALRDLPWKAPPDVDWNNANIWYPDDERDVDEDSIDAAEGRQLEAVDIKCEKQLSVESEMSPPAPPESLPPDMPAAHKRTSSMSSDSLAGDPPPLLGDSPPRCVIRNDSLEVEDKDDDKDGFNGPPPPLPASSPPWKPDSSSPSSGQQRSFISGFRRESSENHSETDSLDLPPPLPKLSPPGKPNADSLQSNHDKWRSSLPSYSNGPDSPHPLTRKSQNHTVSTDLDSDASSTDTLMEPEAYQQDLAKGCDSSPKRDHRDDPLRATAPHRPASFDSGLDTVSSITEQEVEAITAASVFVGPDHSLRLPRAPVASEGVGNSLAKPATPMWLKQMMDWQTAEKEKEETDLGRLKTSIDTMEKQLQEKEELVKELRQSEENLRKKLQDHGDLRPLKLQLQTKEIDLQDKERQVALLKSEVKQKEREIHSLKTKSESEELHQPAINKNLLMSKAAEIGRLKLKLERSQESLKEKEEELKNREEEEARMKEEMDKRESELSSKEKALKKESEKLRNLQTASEEQQQLSGRSADDVDAVQPCDTSSHDRSPDSRPQDTTARELHLANILDVLTRENKELRGRVQRLASMEDRWVELQQQLADSRHGNQDQEALERKLHMAEEMLREKTSEELRLGEDNAALEDRIRHLEEQRRRRDGIEADYRRIKEQFDDMEHKKNEAEISVAPLKAKISYLLRKCKERDAIIQRLAAELEQFRPDRNEQLVSDISDLTAVSLPDDEFSEPLAGRGRDVRDLASRTSKDHQVRGGEARQWQVNKFSKSMNDIRVDDLSDDDELGRLSPTRGHLGLDPLSGSLDNLGLGGEGISLRELMRRTAGSRARSHLTPSRGADDLEVDVLRSALRASPTKTTPARRLGRDAHSSSVARTATSLQSNRLSHKTNDTSRDGGLLHSPHRGSPSHTHQQELMDPCNPSLSVKSPIYSSQQQEDIRQPYLLGSKNGDMDSFSPSANGVHSSPKVFSGHTSASSNLNNSTPFTSVPSPVIGLRLQSQPEGHQTTAAPLGQAFAASSAVHPGNLKFANGHSIATPKTAIAHNGSAFGLLTGGITSSDTLAANSGTVGGTTGRHPVLLDSRMQSRTQALPHTGPGSAMQHEVQQNPISNVEGVQTEKDVQVKFSHSAPNSQPVNSASNTVGSAGVHDAIVGQAGHLANGDGHPVNGDAKNAQSVAGVPSEIRVIPNRYSFHASLSGTGMQAPSSGTPGLIHPNSSRHEVDALAMHPGQSTLHSGTETSSQPSTLSTQQLAARGGMSLPRRVGSTLHLQPGVGSSGLHTHPMSTKIQVPLTLSDQQKSVTSQLQPGLSTSDVQAVVDSSTLHVHAMPTAAQLPSTLSSQQINGASVTSHGQLRVSALNIQPEVGSPTLHAGIKGPVANSFTEGASRTPQHHVVSTAAVHPGNIPSGFVSHGSARGSRHGANPLPHQSRVPSAHSIQQQGPDSSVPKVTAESHNGHMASLPGSQHPPLVPMRGSGHMIPPVSTASAHAPLVESNNISAQTQVASALLHPSQHATLFNSTAPLKQLGTPLHHQNVLQGIDEPDQPPLNLGAVMPLVNGQGGQHLPYHGVGRTHHVQGTLQSPHSLSVSKVVGRHGVILTWHPPDLDDLGQNNGLEIVGYKIFVDGHQKQLVTNAYLTKALVEGVNLCTVQSFGIQTVSATGQASPIITVGFEDPGVLSSSLSDSVRTMSSVGRGAVTSDGSSVISEELQERLFMAVYSYNPAEHSPNHYPTYELAFEEGDIITVYGTIRSDGFYQGKVRRKRGLVPSNFIEEISMSRSHLSKKKHGHSKSHRNGIGDTHGHQDADKRGTTERGRTPNKLPSKSREEHKRHGSSNVSRI